MASRSMLRISGPISRYSRVGSSISNRRFVGPDLSCALYRYSTTPPNPTSTTPPPTDPTSITSANSNLTETSTSTIEEDRPTEFIKTKTTPTEIPKTLSGWYKWRTQRDTAGPKDEDKKWAKSKFKSHHIFMGLVGLGLFFTIYTGLEMYFALPQWPEPVRTHLRRALRARNLNDYDRSEAFFRLAIEAMHELPPSAFDPDPLLKLSGIYITFSTMLEESKDKPKAYKVLLEGYNHFGPDPLSTTPSERLSGEWNEGKLLTLEDHVRAIGLAQKLGHLSLQLSSGPRITTYPNSSSGGVEGIHSWLDAAEHHLGQALTAMLHLGLKHDGKDRVVVGRDVVLPGDSNEEISLEGVEGGAVDKRGLGVVMEALAEIYSRKGEYGIAGNLLIQAISTLLPPKSESPPPITDQCQAAMLMTTVSSHALHPLTPKAMKASKSWSLRALQIADQAIQQSQNAQSTDTGINTMICRKALAVAEYNLGILSEMEGDLKASLEKLSNALRLSNEVGFTQGKKQCLEAIQRVKALVGGQ